jgi:hypothetical protein
MRTAFSTIRFEFCAMALWHCPLQGKLAKGLLAIICCCWPKAIGPPSPFKRWEASPDPNFNPKGDPQFGRIAATDIERGQGLSY